MNIFETKNFENQQSLLVYLKKIDSNYKQRMSSIDLFNIDTIFEWNENKKFYFASLLYHIRGHFIDFMWYLANFTPDPTIKKIILDNISEEIGSNTIISHEMLYNNFAQECGVNIHEEILQQKHYEPFIREFNTQHLQWIHDHDVDMGVSAFAAYERLDNIDYLFLLNLVNNLSLPSKALSFFNVHMYVKHFDATLDYILPIWQQDSNKIIIACEFIYEHQLHMWQQFSDYMQLC